MKRIVRLTESDLARIVRRVINEAPTADSLTNMQVKGELLISGVFKPNEVYNRRGGYLINFDNYNYAKVFSATISYTKEGAAFSGKIAYKNTWPKSCTYYTEKDGTKYRDNNGVSRIAHACDNSDEYMQWVITCPANKLVFAKKTQIATITFVTNDPTKPSQTIPVYVDAGSQFGVGGSSRN